MSSSSYEQAHGAGSFCGGAELKLFPHEAAAKRIIKNPPTRPVFLVHSCHDVLEGVPGREAFLPAKASLEKLVDCVLHRGMVKRIHETYN